MGFLSDFHDLDNRWRAGKVLRKKWGRSIEDKGYKSSFPEAVGPFGSLENEVVFKDVISHQRLGKNCAGAVQGSEVLSVVIRPFNQLKITFLEAQDLTDFGSLKEAARIFVPNGATLHSARTLKIKEDEVLKINLNRSFGLNA
ncbi:hypothetical protein QJS04_geneDACA019677 [Acorus gramineus]|uniref:Uncharacterized protein n=1 Tax=Acorus gramineus TaxID=55184 RepID=A0AAV9BL10_ACOGR|nr:hypothetical protein QJS04_geneDACA019677 [Acorus gramineus]